MRNLSEYSAEHLCPVSVNCDTGLWSLVCAAMDENDTSLKSF